jgi:hypothetical protein
MLDYLDERNKDPKPFVWTADADLILDKLSRLTKRIPTRDTRLALLCYKLLDGLKTLSWVTESWCGTTPGSICGRDP